MKFDRQGTNLNKPEFKLNQKENFEQKNEYLKCRLLSWRSHLVGVGVHQGVGPPV